MPTILEHPLNGKKIKMDGQTLILQTAKYQYSGRLAIQAVTEDYEPWAKLTVNLDEPLEEGEFFVKTWEENDPVSEAARNSGLFIDTGKRVKTGFVEAEVWKVNDKT